MKIVVVQYPDSTDISTLVVGQPGSVKVGATEVTGGTVVLAGQSYQPPAALIPHTHGVTGLTSEPI